MGWEGTEEGDSFRRGHQGTGGDMGRGHWGQMGGEGTVWDGRGHGGDSFSARGDRMGPLGWEGTDGDRRDIMGWKGTALGGDTMGQEGTWGGTALGQL